MQTLTAKSRLLITVLLAVGAVGLVPAAARAQLGVSSFNMSLASQQAGAHADASMSFRLDASPLGNPISQLSDVALTLPRGLVGNPQAVPKCSLKTFEGYRCPPAAQVGFVQVDLVVCEGASIPLTAEAVAGATSISVPDAASVCEYQLHARTITIGSGASQETATVTGVEYENYEYGKIPHTLLLAAPLEHTHAAGEAVSYEADVFPYPAALFNVQPLPGHVATFGAKVLFSSLMVNVNVPDGGSNGLQATISDPSTELNMEGATIDLWGLPAEKSHDAERCEEIVLYGCGLKGGEATAFMSNPTNCSASLEGTLAVRSYGGEAATATTTLPALTGCETLQIAPSMSVAPDTTQRDTPAGYELNLKVPQSSLPEGLATPDVKEVSVTLPAGTSLSPGVAAGLQACDEAQFAAEGCPNAAKVGTTELTSPVLAERMTGAIYIGEPTPAEPYPLRVVLSSNTTTIKLSGQVEPNATSGQATAVFANTPQLPFSDLKLNLFGGPGAVFANPTVCGRAVSTSQITSYGGQVATPTSEFTIDGNNEGGSCPASQSFAPRFSAGTTSPQAAGFSPFTLTVSRADGEPSLSSFSAELPPGLLGTLKSVPLCREPQAALGTCAQASEVGTATILAGSGSRPLPVSGPVYLTGPYDGAPFGLSVVVNAVAGPFNLGTAVVRARILIAPSDLHLTIVSDPFPQIMGGIPLRLQTVNVTFNRAGFMFNPSGCSQQAITGTIDGLGGVSAAVSSPFQVAGCESLPFAPKLSAATQAGDSSRGDGASLAVKISSPTQSAGTMYTASIQMPKQLRPRLATIQDACLARTLTTAPSACPPASLVGHATVASPVMTAPLTGPAYLVANGGAAPPSLVLLLQGEGVSVDLTASISISSNGPITADFQSLPDVPLSTFELVLPSGPHSMLGATENVCRKALTVPYKLTDRGGAVFTSSAAVAVSGCLSAKKSAVKSSRRRTAKSSRRRTAKSGRRRATEHSRR